MNMTRSGSNAVIVEIKNGLFNDSVPLNKSNIVIDTSFEPNKFLKTSGTVIKLPISLSNFPISARHNGFPAYGAARNKLGLPINPTLYSKKMSSIFSFMSQIQQDVQINDTIFFSWMALSNKFNVLHHNRNDNSFTCRIPYDLIYAASRNNSIIPIGSYVLIKPILELWDDLYIKTFSKIKDLNGNYIPLPKDKWIITKSSPSHKQQQGVVAHIGNNLINTKSPIKPNDKVLFKPSFKNYTNINESNLFCIKTNDIACISD